MELEYNKTQLKTFCDENNIQYLGVFGSQARNEANKNSDIDLLVEYSKTPSLLTHIKLENEMASNIFNKKVDLVSKKALNKYIAPFVEKDLISLYQA